MSRRLVECIPNFSEGRNREVVEQIAASIGRVWDLGILGLTMDTDHNRSVITFAGSPDAVAEAAIRAVAKAGELIDLNGHVGVHPRIGATDVLPFVPVEGVTMDECVALAVSVGEKIWTRLRIPVYLYEHAARTEERRRLENIRRGQFEELRVAAIENPSRRPDIGGPGLHPTAGATVVGARQFLIAYNINLATPDTAVARDIARTIRASSGGFPHVKALGLPLVSRSQSQVSMNLTDFERTPVHTVYEAVRELAQRSDVEIAGSEIIGLIPKAAIEATADHFLRCENFSPDLVLENRLTQVLPHSLNDGFENIANPEHPHRPAAVTASLATVLGSRCSRLMRANPDRFDEHRRFFQAMYDAGPLDIAQRAYQLRQDLQQLCSECPPELLSTAIAARGVADAALQGAVAEVEFELSRMDDGDAKDDLAQKVRQLK